MARKTVYITITRGARFRDFLRLGVLEHLQGITDAKIVLITPAHQEQVFLDECPTEGVVVWPFKPYNPSLGQRAFAQLRERWIDSRRKLAVWQSLGDRLFPTRLYEDLFREHPADLVVATDPVLLREAPLVAEARRRGIPTLGLVRSWDQVLKGLPARTDRLGVWNAINKAEALEVEYYHPEEVTITGAVQFDPYFCPDVIKPREEFLTEIGLDPNKKLILLATGGPRLRYAQAAWLDLLLDARDDGFFKEPVQLLCRTHPGDYLGPFLPYIFDNEIEFDLYQKWSPTLEWLVDRSDIEYQANSLYHADVVLTPASTITLETAIFDTPTVVLAFPDIIFDTLSKRTFGKHFKPLLARKLVPVVYNLEEMMNQINQYLRSPDPHRGERKEIVADWIYYTDGQSFKRVATLIAETIAELA